MKKILFVINTMGQGGAETALLELLHKLCDCEYELYLYVMLGQGELINKMPPCVRLLNAEFDELSVLTDAGRRRMFRKVCKAFLRNGKFFQKLKFTVKTFVEMIKNKCFQEDKLLWRTVAEGAERFDLKFDLAVAWLEGASAYYVAEYVNADKKTAFIHIDYESAGYTRSMDRRCFEKFDRIFAVSEEVKEHFNAFYPEYEDKTKVFRNIINRKRILHQAQEAGGFQDDYKGIRILSVGRLTWQKAYDIAIDAMKILKEEGHQVKWYVLGEGNKRKSLEKKIASLGLREDFQLLGRVENPYPYYRQTDLYVHVSRYEGKSIALQEAQILGCPVIVSDCNGNREQIINGKNGILCELTPESIAENIMDLCKNKGKRKALGREAQLESMQENQEVELLWNLI